MSDLTAWSLFKNTLQVHSPRITTTTNEQSIKDYQKTQPQNHYI